MSFVEGQSLASQLGDGPLPPREAAKLMVQVAEPIEYAHRRGVIHRDLKPGNILLDRDGKPRVTDFGLAKRLQSDCGLTGSGQIMGTPSYMPPEQAGGNRGEIGPAADIYAMGATLYALLTGRPPFQAATATDTVLQVLNVDPVPPRRLNASISRDLETICLKCLEKDPRRRYASAAALGDELRRYLDDRPISARPVTRWERGLRWARRNPAIARLSASLTVLTLAAITTVVLLLLRDARHRREALDAITKERNLAIAAGNEAKNERNIAVAAENKAVVQSKVAAEKEREALAQAELADRRLYGVNMVMVQRAWDNADLPLFRRLIDEQRQSPMGADRRGFEWSYWARRDQSGATVWRQPVWVASVAFSPDGRWCAVSGVRAVTVWDLETGRVRHVFDTGAEPDWCVVFSPDSKWLATAGGNADNRVQIYDVASGRLDRRLTGHAAHISQVAFSPDGKLLASCDNNGEVRIWDLEATVAVTIALRADDPVAGSVRHDLAFGPEGRWLVAAGGAALVCDPIGGRIVARLPNVRVPTALGPDRSWLVCADAMDSSTLQVWDLTRPDAPKSTPLRDAEPYPRTAKAINPRETGTPEVSTLAVSPDGRRIAVGRSSGELRGPHGLVAAAGIGAAPIRLLDRADTRVIWTAPAHPDNVSSLVFAPDGSRVISG